MKTHSLTSISLAALVASVSLIACGGAEVEPIAQEQASVSQPAAEPPADDKPAREAMRHDGEHRGWHGKGRGKHGPPSPEKMLELVRNELFFRVSPCCYLVNTPGHDEVRLKDVDVVSAWNAPSFQELRHRLVEGPLYGACQRCPENW